MLKLARGIPLNERSSLKISWSYKQVTYFENDIWSVYYKTVKSSNLNFTPCMKADISEKGDGLGGMVAKLLYQPYV